ncbi:MAG: hypothetical protein KAJ73_08930 [Zetaproteobacteria bacterium]|nr:hypothetical protein [Zetaproteobacteria bacterium]
MRKTLLAILLALTLIGCNQPTATPIVPTPSDIRVVWFEAELDVGAQGSPIAVGTNGVSDGILVSEEIEGAILCKLWINVSSGRDYSGGVGSGGFQIFLPSEADHCLPSYDGFQGSANMWMAGAGQKEHTGNIKFTFRNPDHGPKLIFSFGGVEFTPREPKTLNEFKLRAYMEYFAPPE